MEMFLKTWENIQKYWAMSIQSFNIYFLGIHIIYWAILVGLLFLFIFSISLKSNRKVWLNVVLGSYGFVLIGGLFAKGKTRMLSMIALLWKKLKQEVFIISNFDNGYSDIFYSSLDDFINILEDLIFLGDYQNFSHYDRNEILKKFPSYFGKIEKDENGKIINPFEEFKKKYKFIPTNGYHNNFLLLGDEFHQYFYNTDSAFFATEKGRKLLQTIHQIRHYNTFAVLATQELDELALKFRKLASYEIETETLAGGFLFNSFIYERNRKNKYSSETADEKEYRKINKKPIYFWNNYLINQFSFIINKILFYFYKKFWKYEGDFFRIIPKKEELKFKSKFNVKTNIDTYIKGSIFDKINDFYKNKKKFDKYKEV